MTTSPETRFPEKVSTYLTTEHFTLQGARSIINGEIASRVSLYFTTLSSILIAAAFVAQIPEMSQLLFLLGILAFPLVILLGLFTGARLGVLGLMDVTLIRAINRIRHFYVESTPEAAPFLLFPPYDDMRSTGIYGGWKSESFGDNLLSAGNAVIITNSLVATVLVAALTSDLSEFTLRRFLPQGIVIFLLAFFVHYVVAVLFVAPKWRVPAYREFRFPAPTSDETAVEE